MKLVLMGNLVSCYFQVPVVFGPTNRCSRTGQTAPLVFLDCVRELLDQQRISPAAELGR